MSLLHVIVFCAVVSSVQGAYVGITAGLISTLWVGIGAQIYKPPVLGPVPPPMSTADCPCGNVSVSDASTTYLPDFLSTTEANSTFTDMYV